MLESATATFAPAAKRFRPASAVARLAILLLALAAMPGRTATITVTSTADSGPGTLRAALGSAADGDTINFAVTGTILLTNGELLVSNSVTIAGPSPGFLAVNGQGSDRVFHIAPSGRVTIAGLTITNGYARFPQLPFSGGILNDHAALTVSNCVITGNPGGGLYNNGQDTGDAFVIVRDSTLANNSGTGGIWNDGEYPGGGATVVVSNCIIRGNSSYYGGGIRNLGLEGGSASVEVYGTTIISNSAASGYGGGIYNGGSTVNAYPPAHANLQVVNSTISSNSATIGGGIASVASLGTASVVVVNCTLSGNSAQTGGGIYSSGYSSGSASLQVSSSTFSGNAAPLGVGGGINNNGSSALQLTHSTFSGNSAYMGGSIYNGGATNATVTIGSTILDAGLSGGTITNDLTTGTVDSVVSLGYNLSSDDAGGCLTNTGDLINLDARLGPLQDNGGPTLTQAPYYGSPAINGGDPNFTPPPYFDQRGPGFPRVLEGRIDIGALEVPTPPPCSSVVTSTADDGLGSLRAALRCATSGEPLDLGGISGVILLTSGELIINKNINIVGPGPSRLTVDGNNAGRVFHIRPGFVVKISGLSITHGQAPNSGFQEGFGGGILNEQAALTLDNCFVVSNSAAGGGGVGSGGDSVTGSLTLLNSLVSSNSAVNGAGIYSSAALLIQRSSLFNNSGFNGGGIFQDTYETSVPAQISDSLVGSNSAVSGGGIFFLGPALSLSNCTVEGNSASEEGGAIAHYGQHLELASSEMSSNSASGGGAIYSRSTLDRIGAEVTLHQCTLHGNSARGLGGAIYSDPSEGNVRLSITASTLSSNSAFTGGGIVSGMANGMGCCGSGGAANLEIANSTLSGNSTFFRGGVIYSGGVQSSYGPTTVTAAVHIVNCTLSDNTDLLGNAGIYNDGGFGPSTVTLGSTILKAGASTRTLTNSSGLVASLGYNLCSDDGGGFLAAPADQINTEPMLGPLQDNGGPTLTHALLPGSPAIDQGKNFSGSANDQRGPGFARTVKDLCAPEAPGGDGTDIGAFEGQTGCTPAAAVQRLLDLVNSQWARPQPLRASLDAALASLDRGKSTAAINQLEAFQHKVRAQVAPSDPVLAQTLTQAAQDVINALGSEKTGPGRLHKASTGEDDHENAPHAHHG
jgi:predicted outer membrane repeat protein